MTERAHPLIELRQYLTQPGACDELVTLFDGEFLESQEAEGISVLGQFRDEDDPDRFAWLRSFPDMTRRAAALTAFYVDSAAWRAHGAHATGLLRDVSDVLLLRPLTADSGFPGLAPRPDPGATELPDTRLLVTVYPLRDSGAGFADFFASRLQPVLRKAGADPIAVYVTEQTPNEFPMPVRTGHTLTWFARFENTDQLQSHLNELEGAPEWARELLPELHDRLSGPIEQRRLAPTARSAFR
ncbi:NIPSNAP family protein [Nocardia inohanensis]|uniref:NIPSNAP family protein n=1 Tax=Nocardia inohanensis TaxID=209246 RepID=UPI00082ED1C0|nr:NIPSNAP family protein [Nocardia inohanensis]